MCRLKTKRPPTIVDGSKTVLLLLPHDLTAKPEHQVQAFRRTPLVDLKRDIMRRIKSIPSTEYQLILEKRYLCFMQWEQIAVAMGYSIQHIYRLHDRALNEFPVPDER